MGDQEDRPESPPLPRGSYNINFDELDDTIDPFKPRGGLSLSPRNEISNPFQTKSKLPSSPPIQPSGNNQNLASEENVEEVDPFKSGNKLGRSPPDQESFPDLNNQHISSQPIDIDPDVNPFQTKTKLGHSPPAVTEEENPFQTKNKLGYSPPVTAEEENPFQTRSKLSSSPPSDSGFSESMENPFQTKSKLGRSPPKEDKNLAENDLTTSQDSSVHENNNDSVKPPCESQTKNNKGFKTKSKSQSPVDAITDEAVHNVTNDSVSESETTKPEKKVISPKKSGMKKPKAKSKFKRPPVQAGSEDVVIFAPPQKSANQNDAITSDQPVRNENEVGLAHQMTVSEIVRGAGGMIDSVHDFGASEMPIDNNEEFVPASEAFNDDAAWNRMEQMKSEQTAAPRESLNDFDPLVDQVPDKVTRRSSGTDVDALSGLPENDLMLMNTPPNQKPSTRSVARHPAARALQEQVDGDGAPREAHIMDKMLFSPQRGEDGKPSQDSDERYFDAPEYPPGNRKGPQGDSEVERMNAANKKQGSDQDNIVQLVQVLKYSQSDWNKMRQNLELDYNARILNKEKEWSKKLADRDKKIAYLDEQVLLLRSANEDMKCVVTEFEKTIAQLQADKLKTSSESQQSYEDVVKQKDQAVEDLLSVETAFSDLHQRYERTKGILEGYKKNEEKLKKCVEEHQAKLRAAEEKMVAVRQQAEEKLAQASDEMDRLRKTTTAEVARLEAAHKKSELKIQGLERSLEQKIQENSELTAICDELIAKVGD